MASSSDHPISPTASLDELAVGIRREIEAADNAWQDAVTHALAAGELLRQAKSKIRHGE
jgi:hypothetical protein